MKRKRKAAIHRLLGSLIGVVLLLTAVPPVQACMIDRPEVLTMAGKEYVLLQEYEALMAPYLDQPNANGILRRDLIPKSHYKCLNRNYWAAWRIENNRLFLVGFQTVGATLREDPAIQTQLFGHPVPVFADWVTGPWRMGRKQFLFDHGKVIRIETLNEDSDE